MDMTEKRKLLIEYADRFGAAIFVETRTGDGETLRAMWKSKRFEQMHTIDASIDRAEAAYNRLHHLPHIHCWKGDSTLRLGPIIRGMRKPILFWLNSGKESVAAELETALAHPNAAGHIVLIDGARRFRGRRLQELRKLLPEDWAFELGDDVVRCHRKENDETAA